MVSQGGINIRIRGIEFAYDGADGLVLRDSQLGCCVKILGGGVLLPQKSMVPEKPMVAVEKVPCIASVSLVGKSRWSRCFPPPTAGPARENGKVPPNAGHIRIDVTEQEKIC